MIKAILYDLDGVLVDMCDAHYISLNAALYDISGYKINYDDHMKRFNGLPTKTKLKMLIDDNIIVEPNIDRIYELKQQHTIEYINKNITPDYNKIKLHIWTNQKGIISACVTNSIRDTAKLVLEKSGQLRFMSFLISNEDVQGHNKPSPECYLKAINILDLKLDEILIVEDSEKGIQAAISSGALIHKVSGPHEVDLSNIRTIYDQYSNSNGG